MNELGTLYIVSEVDDDHGSFFTKRLTVVYLEEPDTIWEVNREIDLYLWRGIENKYFFVRFIKHGF